MARRRTTHTAETVLPAALLSRDARAECRAWLDAHGVHGFRDQYAATVAARRHHGMPDPPDPRLLLDPLRAGNITGTRIEGWKNNG